MYRVRGAKQLLQGGDSTSAHELLQVALRIAQNLVSETVLLCTRIS